MSDTGTQTIYSGRSTNWPMLCLFLALLVPLVAMAKGPGESWSEPGLLVPLLVVVAAAALTVVTATSVRTLAGPKGVSVHLGVFGWPRFRYAPERIATAEAIVIPRSQWGWGMTWGPRSGLLLTLRTGPALRLVLTSGRPVTISTPDPEAALAALDRARP